MSKTLLEERQREMAARLAAKPKLLRPKVIGPFKTKSKGWLEDHLTEALERIIDDLGLDVPRREPKLTA